MQPPTLVEDDLKITAGVQLVDAGSIKVRCPACHHAGVFYPIGTKDASWDARERLRAGQSVERNYRVGVRRCPNPECNTVLFVSLKEGAVIESFPNVTIDFDATNLPEAILSTLEEAVKCHSAGCYRAAALMVRKTLENLCADKQAKGANLKLRIADLRNTIVISSDLLDAADELRLLGNDAAHVEAQAYDAIEAEEVEVAIELTKELLKAVYQHTSLVARLRALKMPPATP